MAKAKLTTPFFSSEEWVSWHKCTLDGKRVTGAAVEYQRSNGSIINHAVNILQKWEDMNEAESLLVELEAHVLRMVAAFDARTLTKHGGLAAEVKEAVDFAVGLIDRYDEKLLTTKTA